MHDEALQCSVLNTMYVELQFCTQTKAMAPFMHSRYHRVTLAVCYWHAVALIFGYLWLL